MSSIGSSSSSSHTATNSNTSQNNTNTNTNSKSNSPNTGMEFDAFPELQVKHILSFLDPKDAVNMRRVTKRLSQIATTNDVWAEFVTDKVKADLKARKTADGKNMPLQEREMTTLIVNGKAVPAVQSRGAYQQAYMNSFEARRLWVGGKAELAYITAQLRALIPLYDQKKNFEYMTKFIQMNTLTLNDCNTGYRTFYSHLKGLNTDILDVLIDYIQNNKLTGEDLKVLPQYLAAQADSITIRPQDLLKLQRQVIKNYLKLKQCGLTPNEIQSLKLLDYRIALVIELFQSKILNISDFGKEGYWSLPQTIARLSGVILTSLVVYVRKNRLNRDDVLFLAGRGEFLKSDESNKTEVDINIQSQEINKYLKLKALGLTESQIRKCWLLDKNIAHISELFELKILDVSDFKEEAFEPNLLKLVSLSDPLFVSVTGYFRNNLLTEADLGVLSYALNSVGFSRRELIEERNNAQRQVIENYLKLKACGLTSIEIEKFGLLSRNIARICDLFELKVLNISHFKKDTYPFGLLELVSLSDPLFASVIGQFRNNLLNQEDLEVLSSAIDRVGLSEPKQIEERNNAQRQVIENYSKLKSFGLNARQIEYYCFGGISRNFLVQSSIWIDILQRHFLSPAQLIELYQEIDTSIYGRCSYITPTLVKYLEEGLITFDMLKLLVGTINALSMLVAINGSYGNKMRAVYEGLCELIKADGAESWALFSQSGILNVLMQPLMQRIQGSYEGGAYFSMRLEPQENNYVGMDLSQTQFGTDIKEGTVSSESQFTLFTDLKAIVKQEGAEFSPRVLKNLIFICSQAIEDILDKNDTMSFREYSQTARELLQVVLSRQNLTVLSEATGMNLLEVLEQEDYSPKLVDSFKLTHALSDFQKTYVFLIFAMGPKGLKSKAEIQTFIDDFKTLSAAAQNFKKPTKIPAGIDQPDYVELVMDIFMQDLLNGKSKTILSSEFPKLMESFQNFHDIGGLEQFSSAVKAGLPADSDKNIDLLLDCDDIPGYVLANHRGLLDLSDITEFVRRDIAADRGNSVNYKNGNYCFYGYLSISRALGALLDGKATKEEWLNGTIDLEALEALDAGSGSGDESGSDAAAPAPAVFGPTRQNDDDDGSEG